jgi:membrane fusion protein, multidrug efflux system
MKKLSLVITALLLISCGDKKTVDELIKENNTVELGKLKGEYQTELGKIDAYLSKNKKTDEALVSFYSVKDTVFNHCIEIQGDVQTKENIIIYPEFAGTLTYLGVKNGQRVGKGQILARIADSGLSQQLAQAEAGYSLAKTTYERQKNLWDKKIGSEIQFLQAQTQMQTAAKAVALVREQISKTVVRAPFSGTIEDVMIEKGQVVAPGDPRGLMRIVNIGNMYVTTQVPEVHVGKVKVGSQVEVEVASVQGAIQGKVRQVSNNINAQNRSFAIEVAVPNKDNKLRPNQVAKLKIVDYQDKNALVVPSNVLLEDANKQKYVYIVENGNEKGGIAKKVMVKIGQSYNNFTQILSGISENDKVVQEGVNTISEGMKLSF